MPALTVLQKNVWEENMATKMTIDGNTAAAHIAYAFSDVAAIYPITPSSDMATYCDEWAAKGRKNLFGQVMRISEMQSEAGAAGAVHGSLAAGAMTTTFTASQGLLLMIPNMYKISGELLPSVFHVSARALAAHALSIFGDHSDVMSTRQTGFAMLASGSVQEVMDTALVAHLATLKSSIPFLHFFDGFRTSHEIQKVDGIDYDEIAKLVDWDAIKAFRDRGMNPEHPDQRGTAQNPDIYFQNREAANKHYDAIPAIVQGIMDQVSALTGRKYNLFDYVGAPDAERVIVLMGSGCDVAEETIRMLTASGEKVGVLKVRLYRPFSACHFIGALPKSVKSIAVLDRTKEPGSLGEPLYEDVMTTLREKGMCDVKCVGGRYGLGSKEFTPAMVKAVLDNLSTAEPRNHFTVGINDDVSFTSLPYGDSLDTAHKSTTSCLFYGIGSDGTVGANKNSIKIIGDHTDKYVQGYFAYDSKKSGGITISHLRFGDERIQSPYLINLADFVACHNPSYITRYDMLSAARPGATFLLNCSWSVEELDEKLPAKVKNIIAQKGLNFYIVDAIEVATRTKMGGRINTIMQAAFFKISNIIPYEDAEGYMKAAAKYSYSKRGDAVVQANYDAIDNAIAGLKKVDVPAAWANTADGAAMQAVKAPEYFQDVILPILRQEGDSLPVSAFDPAGIVPVGTTQYEKRGIAVKVPCWISGNCIQCNMCSFVCPHGTIRPVLVDPANVKDAPEGFDLLKATGVKPDGLQYRMQVYPLDCTGCGNCVDVCLAKNKALEMKPLEETLEMHQAHLDYCESLPVPAIEVNTSTVKGSQYLQPLFEFSGACAGCGETPYVKLITQLYGDRMLIANATGCSSIYGGSSPTCPYTTNEKGHGPAWANSLFEDNAEFGYGMQLAMLQRRARVADQVVSLKAKLGDYAEGIAICDAWLEGAFDAKASRVASEKLLEMVKKCAGCGCDCDEECKFIIDNADILVKKSIWIFGGDGWAYDIGYGGLDHVLAQGEDVNVLVMDTEVYSNTGGQASKATPLGSTAKFAVSGKRTRKKDLGLMAMSYGYVYVAQVAMGANANQLMKAVTEAEAYNGPSLIIAYAPCINHGINMSLAQAEARKAVEVGYWQLYRYNPALEAEGKNPFTLDSKPPQGDYQSFLRSEARYTALLKSDPAIAEDLFQGNERDAQARYNTYKRLAD